MGGYESLGYGCALKIGERRGQRHGQSLIGADLTGVTAAGHQRHDPIADAPSGHVLSSLHDITGRFQAENLAFARRGWVVTQPLVNVGPIDAAGSHPDPHLSRRKFWRGRVADI